MDVKAEHRYAKISAFKVREVTREIQGLPAEAALEIVRLIPKKSARLIGKVLASAIANAENNNNLRAVNLVVKQAVAGEGPTHEAHAHPRPWRRRPHQQAHRTYQDHAHRGRTDRKTDQGQGRQEGQGQAYRIEDFIQTGRFKEGGKGRGSTTAAPALVAPEPDPSQLRAEAADKTSKSLAAGEHPEKVTAAD